MRYFLKHTFLAFVICTATTSTAFAKTSVGFTKDILAQPMPIEEGNVRLQGYRFLNANGEPNTGDPVIIPHGLHSNLHEFEHLVKLLMSLGFDCFAFNSLGHGNGDEKSVVLDYHEGDYSFEALAITDFPLTVKAVYRLTGKKIHIIGHSMGGMIPRASMALGSVDQNMIKSMVLIGSPPHFRTKSSLIPESVLKIIKNRIFSGSGQDKFSVLDAFHDLETSMDLVNLINPAYWLAKFVLETNWGLLQDVVEMLGVHESSWAARARTKFIPKDIMRSFANYQDHYPYEEVKLDVPTLYIMGDSDVLVKESDVVESAQVQSRQGGFWFYTLKGVGHLSLVAPPAIKLYSETLKKFLMAPESVGPANETHLKGRPSPSFNICRGILLGA